MINKIVPLAAFSLFVILISGNAFAFDDPRIIPHGFWGEVTVNGNPVPDGWLVSARIDGSDVAGGLTSDGFYGKSPNSVMKVPGETEGKKIEFFVNDVKGGEHVFKSGNITRLDLSITGDFCGDGICTSGESCSTCPSECGACDSGGSGGSSGGSSGGAYVPPAQTTEDEVCEPDWKCTGWFQCVEGYQERVCTDQKICGTDEERPAEIQECEVKMSGNVVADCEMGERICDGDDAYVCSKDGNFLFMEKCDYGCSAGECSEESIFSAISTFFGNLFGGMTDGSEGAESDQMTGFSVQSGTLIGAAAIGAVILALVTAFFIRKRN